MQGKKWGIGEWLGFAGVMIGLLGLGGSYYFYKLSEKEKEPILLVDPYRAVIVEAKSIKDFPLKVVGRDGAPVEKDITSMRFYFWNEGRESIKKSDILKPVKFFLDSPEVEIIDYKILSVSRSDIVQPHISLDQGGANSIDLSFDILEQNDGFGVQIIFAGPPDVEAEIKGVIEGTQGIKGNASVSSYHFYKMIGGIFGIPLFFALFGFIIAKLIGGWAARRFGEAAVLNWLFGRWVESRFAPLVPIVMLVLVVIVTSGTMYSKEKQRIDAKVMNSMIGTVPESIRSLPDSTK